MGYQGKGFALVSMTNGDVYYVTSETGQKIQERLARNIELSYTGFIDITDVKSGAKVSLALQHVSSVIVKDGGRDV